MERSFQHLFLYLFALLNYVLYLFLALRSGRFFRKPTEQEQLRLAISRDQFWNLSKQPIPGFGHAFYKLRNGSKLHYLTNRPTSNASGDKKGASGNLFIMLHGWPDSAMMWRHCLKEPAIPIHTSRLVCLDLPNFGGSDTFPRPDTAVLEAVTEFIVAMRELHEEDTAGDDKEFSTVIVAHDWGCAIAFRLAAEAPQLADRFILSNGPHVGLALANKDRIIASAAKIFKQFKENPTKNFACLSKSFSALKPLLRQVMMSGYIFVFQLPSFMLTYMGSIGNMIFLRTVVRMSAGRHKEEYNEQECLASTLGPGVIEVNTRTSDGENYGESVHERAASVGTLFWRQTAYYRNGLAFNPWEKTLETAADLYNLETESEASNSPIRRRFSSSATSGLFSEHYAGALRAPSTIVWGAKDSALSRVICLDGIGDYLAKGSEVILLPQTGHWAPAEKESRAALAKIISLCAATAPSLPTYFSKDVEQIYEGSTCPVRR